MSSRFRSLPSSLKWLAAGVALLASADVMAAPPAADAPRVLLLDVHVNGQPVAGERFLTGADGKLYVRRSALAAWRIRSFDPRSIVHQGEHYVALSDVKEVRIALDDATQSVRIDAATALFEPTVASLSASPKRAMTRSPAGAFVNYEAFVEHSRGDTAANAAVEIGVFTPKGVGSTSFIARADSQRLRVTRLDTSWTIDRPESLTSIRLGDTISRGGVGGVPLRFGGIQWTRNFGVQPGFVTLPLPAVAGSAALPSVVDIYVDGALRGSREVAPGPFQIHDVPVVTGGGEVRAVVRDLLGREVVTSVSYYASSQSLRAGLSDFSYEAGFLRRDYALRSTRYGAGFASATHRYGLTDRLTIEGHAAVSARRQNGGVGAALALPTLGLFTLAASASNGPRGGGGAVSIAAERRIDRVAFGLRSEFTTRDYGFLGLPGRRRTPSSTITAFADANFGFGSVGANYLRRKNRDQSDEEIVGLFGSVNVGRNAAFQLYAQRSTIERTRTTAGLNLTIPFGSRGSVSATAQVGRNSRLATLSGQRDPPAGEGIGYRASVTRGDIDSLDAQLDYRGAYFAADVRAVQFEGAEGVRVGVSGGVGWLADRFFASRHLGQSFALVDVDGRAGVRIYADNHLVGVTGRDGFAVVPGLRPYEDNHLAVDIADIPIDAELAIAEQSVRPYDRSGVVVRFDAPRIGGALIRLVGDDGPPPPGAEVSLDDGTTGVVAPGGVVWLTNPRAQRRGRVSWGAGACHFAIDAALLASAGATPATLICRRTLDVAAR